MRSKPIIPPILPSLLLFLAVPAFAQAAAPAAESAPTTEANVVAPAETREFGLSSPDTQIAARLRGIFAEIDGLTQVRADVNGGVVKLSGVTLSTAERAKAEAVASRLAGVVTVENDIEVERRVSRRLEPMALKANALARDAIAFVPLLIVALLVLAGFWLLGRLLTSRSGPLRKIAPNPLIQTLIMQIVRLAFVLVGLIMAMRLIGATALLGSVLGAAGVIGLAVGFAVRDTLENYVASILLSVRRPFAPNDHIILDGEEGRVVRLNSRATFLTSMDGNEIRIPNAIVYKSKIINFTQIPERRFEFTVGVGYENDLCDALSVAMSAVKDSSGVVSTHEPIVIVDALDSSTVSIKVLAWMDQQVSDFQKVRSGAIRAVKAAFDSAGISMPEPIQNVRVLDETHDVPRSPPDVSRVEQDAISDTSANHVIERKARGMREKGGEDLLTSEAPRE